MTWGAVGTTAVSLLAANEQRKAAKRAASRQEEAALAAAEQAEFNPYQVSGSAFGDVAFDKEAGTAQFNLSPEMQALSQLFGQQAQQFAGQGQTELGALAGQGGLGFLRAGIETDPFATAQTQFERMEEILAPSRQRQREALESRLLRQGRLGSTGGALQQEGLESAIEQSRRQGLVEALGQGMGIQAQQLAQGQQLGLLGQQQQDVGFQQAMARLGGLQGIEQQMFNLANLGSALGGRQSTAGAQAGAFGMQGATSGTAALLGGAAGQAQALGKIGTALGNYFDGTQTPSGGVTSQTPYGEATMSPTPQYNNMMMSRYSNLPILGGK